MGVVLERIQDDPEVSGASQAASLRAAVALVARLAAAVTGEGATFLQGQQGLLISTIADRFTIQGRGRFHAFFQGVEDNAALAAVVVAPAGAVHARERPGGAAEHASGIQGVEEPSDALRPLEVCDKGVVGCLPVPS